MTRRQTQMRRGQARRKVGGRLLPGPHSEFRPKTDDRCSFRMTKEGHRALKQGMRKTGLSRNDHLERLAREFVGASLVG